MHKYVYFRQVNNDQKLKEQMDLSNELSLLGILAVTRSTYPTVNIMFECNFVINFITFPSAKLRYAKHLCNFN